LLTLDVLSFARSTCLIQQAEFKTDHGPLENVTSKFCGIVFLNYGTFQKEEIGRGGMEGAITRPHTPALQVLTDKHSQVQLENVHRLGRLFPLVFT